MDWNFIPACVRVLLCDSMTGMERTTPHRHSRVLDGLKKFSARTGHQVDWQFFSEHVEFRFDEKRFFSSVLWLFKRQY